MVFRAVMGGVSSIKTDRLRAQGRDYGRLSGDTHCSSPTPLRPVAKSCMSLVQKIGLTLLHLSAPSALRHAAGFHILVWRDWVDRLPRQVPIPQVRSR